MKYQRVGGFCVAWNLPADTLQGSRGGSLSRYRGGDEERRSPETGLGTFFSAMQYEAFPQQRAFEAKKHPGEQFAAIPICCSQTMYVSSGSRDRQAEWAVGAACALCCFVVHGFHLRKRIYHEKSACTTTAHLCSRRHSHGTSDRGQFSHSSAARRDGGRPIGRVASAGGMDRPLRRLGRGGACGGTHEYGTGTSGRSPAPRTAPRPPGGQRPRRRP